MAPDKLFFNATLAIRSVRNNKLRSGITICIIALGIMALVGILTAIEGLKSNIYSNFSSMGANTFQITNEMLVKKSHGAGMSISSIAQKDITYPDAEAFVQQFNFPAVAGISMIGSSMATVKKGPEKTNPNIMVLGVDDHYLMVSGTGLLAGRNFSGNELSSGAYVCILGNEIAGKLFNGKIQKAIGQTITVGYISYRVIGVAEPKSSSMISNVNNNVFIPLQNARAVYGGSSFVISIHVPDVAMMDMAASEAEGLFRVIRKIPPGMDNNFSINKNDELASMVMSNISTVSIAAMFIGFITLLGAAIGLMNIMLVSVAERTREIGVSKALGAKNSTIKSQFLSESVMISLAGGLIGVIAGILIGNVVSIFLKSGFIIPWVWMILGFILCTIVGLLSGVYPAAKAAKLDPIQALRYE
ncbi:MAG TPA: ABC transporter permease [Edaphocola sp.]|nr:ABC transporter permease [Edaphocola sp.]